jgi:hypothetical protein
VPGLEIAPAGAPGEVQAGYPPAVLAQGLVATWDDDLALVLARLHVVTEVGGLQHRYQRVA